MPRLIVYIALFLSLSGMAQQFSFVPSSEYYGTLEMDMYTEHYMFIGHDLQDSAYITWRLVENTCPGEWDIQACDYQHCYTGLPNYGNMSGVAAGGQGYLRMIVNPFLIAGSGTLHFLIYPTGEPLNYTDAYFHFSTTLVNTGSAQIDSESVVAHSNLIRYSGPTSGEVALYDANGKCLVSIIKTDSSLSLPIDHLPCGLFFLRTPTGRTFRILKSH
jgi:hypothetical protein